MILKTKDLRAFKQASAHIKSTGQLPILDYLKFDTGTVTKNNLQAFIVYDMPGAQSMIVEEAKLMSMVSNTRADEINITMKGGQVYISDGVTVKKIDSIEDEFPVNVMPEEESFTITGELLDAIGTAAAFTADADIDIFTSFVFLGEKHICASDNFIGYFDTVLDDVPNIILRREVAMAISKMGQCRYNETGNYQFFTVPGCIYGFNKREMNYRQLHLILANNTNAEPFTANKSGIIEFCAEAIADSPLKTLTAVMQFSKDTLQLSMNDNSYNYELSRPVGAYGEDSAPFSFNPAFMLRLLKAMPGDTMTFAASKGSYFITAESGAIALIMEMAKS